MRTTLVRIVALVALLAPLGLVSVANGNPVSRAAASPAAATKSPCAPERSFIAANKSRYKSVTIANTDKAYVLGPVNPVGAKHAAIVMLHGSGGDFCSLWWAARLLAGKNYVTLVVTYSPATSLSVAEEAGRSALTWLRDPAHKPFNLTIKSHDLAIIGHSVGAHAAANLQETEDVRTIVALDNLPAYIVADRSSGSTCKNQAPSEPVKPVVPALSIGSEVSCFDSPPFHGAANKLTGFYDWISHRVPVLQATLAQSTHSHFSGTSVNTPTSPEALHVQQLKRAGEYIVIWLNIWLRNKTDQYPKLISSNLGSETITSVLSSKNHYESAAFLPKNGSWHGRECFDLRGRQCGPIV